MSMAAVQVAAAMNPASKIYIEPLPSWSNSKETEELLEPGEEFWEKPRLSIWVSRESIFHSGVSPFHPHAIPLTNGTDGDADSSW